MGIGTVQAVSDSYCTKIVQKRPVLLSPISYPRLRLTG